MKHPQHKVTVRRFEGGDMMAIIDRTLRAAGIEYANARRFSVSIPRFHIGGKIVSMKGLVEIVDSLRVKDGLEPLVRK